MGIMTTRDRREARAERLEGWAAKREVKGNAAIDQAKAQAAMIPFGQPMLTDHHSYRGDRNRRARTSAKFDRGFGDLAKGREMASKAATIRAATAGSIFTDDEDAVGRLVEKIEKLTAERDRIKAFNASCKTIEGGDWSLLTDAEGAHHKRTIEVCPWQCKGGRIPGYALTNLGATIRKAQQRLDSLRAAS
jgi:hypothetical protein